MINASFMYMRPWNLYKDFIVEDGEPKLSKTGRPIVKFSGDGSRMLSGVLADATEQQKETYSTSDHIVTHTITQPGIPIAKRNDRLILEDRVFYIVNVDDTGSLGVATLYYAEERSDVK